MCGIVGYVGSKKAAPVLIEGLRKLEYRGYDSAGIAVIHNKEVRIERAEGKLKNLSDKIKNNVPLGHIGIGHTRWATHGKPTERNAHPHQAGQVIVVHNGIIENYETLKKELPRKGAELKSETDTEIICQLISLALVKTKVFFKAFLATLKKLEGSYALVVLDINDPDKFYVAKKGSPLVVGYGTKENFVASDIPAMLAHTRDFVFLEDGEMAVISARQVEYYLASGKPLHKKSRKVMWDASQAEKEGFKHFMLKEVFEQPRALVDTLRGRIQVKDADIEIRELEGIFKGKKFPPFNHLYIVACGTSWHAALAGRYYIEAIAKIPVSVDTASEFRYREPFIDKKTLLVVISQSGETADTLACVQDAKKRGAKIISICNAVESSIPRASHATLYTQAGPEIGVASTKAFTTQLTMLLLLSLYFGKKAGFHDKDYVNHAFRQLRSLPSEMSAVLKQAGAIKKIAQKYSKAKDIYFLARGVHYPIALEGALKLKEISYIHAEGFAAGEMKHGPIALIEEGTPVVAIAPQDRVCEKMVSNIQEVRARGAKVFVIATAGDNRFKNCADEIFFLPKTEWYLAPILASIPLQLLAYYIADIRGCDVDQPRNLAKSVTVE